MTTLVDINNYLSYKAFKMKDTVCYKMTHIIKVNETNGNIYLNNNFTEEFGPVVTLSTNTDFERDLNRDSFGIIKFIDETDDLVDKCVGSGTFGEEYAKENKKLSKINRLKKQICSLTDTSIKINNSTNALERHSKLKEYINKYFYPPEILNLEIYEFLLKNYPEDGDKKNIITTSIEESSDDECGIIQADPIIQNVATTKQSPRSCDPISGKIKDNKTTGKIPLTPSDNPTYDFSLNINGEIIKSSDLIKFTNIFGAKQSDRKRIDPITDRIDSMLPLYTESGVKYIFNSVGHILENQWIINIGDPKRPDFFYNNYSLIKILKPNKYQKFIVIGDLHGSFATFIRILLRFRKMGIMNENGILINDHHVIFLGDVVDRGIYGYEIMMLLYCLNILNPDNIHLNRGNHEEKSINNKYGLKAQLATQFSPDEVYNLMNVVMERQSSSILIQNPINNKYVYLAHGGLPTNDLQKLDPDFNITNFKNKCLIVSNEIGDNIRWNDFESVLTTLPGIRDRGSSVVTGYDIIREAQVRGIELIIRGHQDHPMNTKLLPLYDPTKLAWTP